MNERNLIWVVPMLLIIGFVIGYISGLNIPKDIKFGLDNETLKLYDKALDIQREQNSYCSKNGCIDEIANYNMYDIIKYNETINKKVE